MDAKKLFSNVWAWVVGAFSLILGLLWWEKMKRKDAEIKLTTANADKDSAVLDERKASISAALEKEKTTEGQLNKEKEEAKEKVKDASLEDLAKLFNKKDGG